MSIPALLALAVLLVVVAYQVGSHVQFRRDRIGDDWAVRVECPTCGFHYNIIHRGACPLGHVLPSPRPRPGTRAHNARTRPPAREEDPHEKTD